MKTSYKQLYLNLSVLIIAGFAKMRIVAFLLLLSACNGSEQMEMVKQQAQLFAESYFNLQFEKAAQCCTPSSQQWIAFHVSNLTQADVDLYNERQLTALCSVDEVTFQSDNEAIVRITMHDFLAADSIGVRATTKAEGSFQISLKKDNEQWLVSMSAPLSELKPMK